MKQMIISGMVLLAMLACNRPASQKQNSNLAEEKSVSDTTRSCCSNLPSRFASGNVAGVDSINSSTTDLSGMVLIDGARFWMGGDSIWGRQDEFPSHQVEVSSFYIDIHEVTNKQFEAFVDATSYITTAEKKPDWEELKLQVPPGTQKPSDDVLVAASLVFTPPTARFSSTMHRPGGHGFLGRIGNIRKGPAVIWLKRMIIRWYMFHGKTRWHSAAGQESDCLPKPNGNLLQEAVNWLLFIRGERS